MSGKFIACDSKPVLILVSVTMKSHTILLQVNLDIQVNSFHIQTKYSVKAVNTNSTFF